MPHPGSMNSRVQRRNALLQQSAALRQELARNSAPLRSTAGWVDLGLDIARSLRTGWDALAPMLALRRQPGAGGSGLVGRIAAVVAVVRVVRALRRR